MTDVRDFRRACHTVARRIGGKVVGFRLATGVTPNFHQGRVSYSGRTVAVVCTRDTAILAVAEPRSLEFVDGVRESGPLNFVDVPELSAALGELPGFRVLVTAELNSPFDVATWPEVPTQDTAYRKTGHRRCSAFPSLELTNAPCGRTRCRTQCDSPAGSLVGFLGRFPSASNRVNLRWMHSDLVALLLSVLAVGTVLGGLPWLAARVRRRGIGGEVLGPFEEMWHPAAVRARQEIDVQVELRVPAPSPGDPPADPRP